MIVDKIENAQLYNNFSENIANALQALKDLDPAELADGKKEIDGDKLFLISQHYETKPLEQGKLEAHRRYIDIQFVAAGKEMLAYVPLEDLEIEEPYDQEKDLVFYKTPGDISPMALTTGMFCILWPDDTHMPGIQLDGPSNVHKIVVKVKING